LQVWLFDYDSESEEVTHAWVFCILSLKYITLMFMSNLLFLIFDIRNPRNTCSGTIGCGWEEGALDWFKLVTWKKEMLASCNSKMLT
jgi:hypothetical protein